jgi:MFS family permease
MPALLASLLVFLTSGAVMVLEILAGRLLAPYVGVTLETFTAIIGVVLAAIAAGTWVGGLLADRIDPRRLLPPTLVLGGGLSILAVPIIRLLGPGTPSAGPLTVVALTTFAFFLPSAVLSAASPLVVKVQLRDLADTGQVVGRLSALGTAGALVGTFVTGFVLVAAFPTTPVVIVVGGLLVLWGIGLWWWFRRDRRTVDATGELTGDAPQPGVRAAAIGGGTGFAVVAAVLAVTASGPCQLETAYFCASVEPDDARLGGRTLVLDTLRHSYVDLDDPTYLEFGYTQILGDIADTVAPPGAPLDTVHIGGGGFTMPGYLQATRPGSTDTVLELDPELVDLAERELGLVLGRGIDAVTGDARVNFAALPDDSADLVIGDAFGGEAVPWHLTTREFAEEIARVLRSGGTYAVNVIDHPPLGFARAQVVTLLDVFEHVAVIGPAGRLAGEFGGNLVILASDDPLPLDAIEAANRARGDDDVVLGDPAAVADFVGGARVLTDDRAPVDQLLTPNG